LEVILEIAKTPEEIQHLVGDGLGGGCRGVPEDDRGGVEEMILMREVV
jgi:hypothetical protein